MEEREAIERLKAGDAGGLDALVEAHYTRAARAAYLIVRDRALAEDVAQGAFVRAYEGIGGFDGTRPFGPWFAKIVLNDAIKAAARRDRAASFYGGDTEDLLGRLADPATGPQELAEEADTSRRVWRALELLPPDQRAAVVQRYYLGMSEAEMAETGASKPGTVKSRLSRARKSLSRLLRPELRARTVVAPPRHQAVRVGVRADSHERGSDRD